MTPDLSPVVWRKATRSGGEGGNCVELGSTGVVRDSKNPDGPVLTATLSDLISAVKRGHVG